MGRLILQYLIATAGIAGGCWVSLSEWADLLPRLMDRAEWLTHSNVNLFFIPCIIFWLALNVGLLLKFGPRPCKERTRERILRWFFVPGGITFVIASFGAAIFRVGLGMAGYIECAELAHGDILVEHRYYAKSPEICARIEPAHRGSTEPSP